MTGEIVRSRENAGDLYMRYSDVDDTDEFQGDLHLAPYSTFATMKLELADGSGRRVKLPLRPTSDTKVRIVHPEE